MSKAKLVDVANDFYEERFEALCEELENGTHAHIYVDCIGHTRAAWVEAAYVQELKKKYGERLVVDSESNWYTVYYLK